MFSDRTWTVGEMVVRTTGTASSGRTLHRVEHVTKGGLPRVSGKLYRKDGRERGAQGWHSYRITPASPEDIVAVKAENRSVELRAEGLRLIHAAQTGGGQHVTDAQWEAVIAALSSSDG